MRLSTKGRYGSRALLDLALHGQEEGSVVLLKDIARRQEISEKYLEHVFSALRKAGLVKSVRGPKGGYYLARDPSKIKLSEVINVLEGSLALVECVEDPSFCDRVSFCVTRDIWAEVGKALNRVLDSITLEDMLKRQEQKLKEKPAGRMYYI